MSKEGEWAKAKKLCRLSVEDIRMAKELGFSPRSLIKNIPSPTQRWKAPVKVWVRELYEERMRKSKRPAPRGKLIEMPPPAKAARNEDFDFGWGWERESEWALADDSDYTFGDSRSPTSNEISEEDAVMLWRQREFETAAEYVASALARHPAVQKVALFGSVAAPLKKEIPRFRKYRRARQELFHECKDVDVAVWVSDLSDLKGLRKARGNALKRLLARRNVGVAHHQVDIFLLEPGTDRYLGRLCNFASCPRGKPECLVENCGAAPFLQLHENFNLKPSACTGKSAQVLFDRGEVVETCEIDSRDVPF